jgi:GST-like protein
MIDLYYWPTPNGRKATVMLEETGLPYTLRPLDITKGEQFEKSFLALNPNNKVPTIVDSDGPGGEPFALFESGAILEYLADKSGMFMPKGERDIWITKQWLMFQMGNVGPLWGQHGHFSHYAKVKIPYAIDRYFKEIMRQIDVMNFRLKDAEYLAGDEYTIADIATYPWVCTYERRDIDLSPYPHFERWIQTVGARPGVERGMSIMDDNDLRDNPDKEHLDSYFGDKQFERRS